MRHGVDSGLPRQTAHGPSRFEVERTPQSAAEASIRPNAAAPGIRYFTRARWTSHTSPSRHASAPSLLMHSA
ncbi:hypothetical protein ACWEIJ_34525 [Lentzea sp. NPDC004789]